MGEIEGMPGSKYRWVKRKDELKARQVLGYLSIVSFPL